VSAFRFLLDEHVKRAFLRALRACRPKIIAWNVGDPGAPPRGTLDPDILIWCEVREFSLITNNRASMPLHLRDHLAAGRHVPGIFVLNTKMTIPETVAEVALINGAADPAEYLDRINYLPLF